MASSPAGSLSIPVPGSIGASSPLPTRPASAPACLPAAHRPAAKQARAPTAPSPASLLPLPHFLLLSPCQTHLELFKPKYSAPSPSSSQIPLQFKTSPALAGGGGRGKGGGHRGGRGRGPALGHRTALAIAQSRHIFPINEERTWISSPVCLRKGSGHPGMEGGCSLVPHFSEEGEACSSSLPKLRMGGKNRHRPWGACAPASEGHEWSTTELICWWRREGG